MRPPSPGKCFSHINDIMYGTLSHSHLLLVLNCLANGATWKVEDEPHMSHILNPDGSFDTNAVAFCDLNMGKVLNGGLMMEILSWKMMVEEPTAASLISQALNSPEGHGSPHFRTHSIECALGRSRA